MSKPRSAALALAAAVLLALAGLALLRPPGSQALPPGFFGIVPQTPVEATDAARMRDGGVETIRLPITWSSVQSGYDEEFNWLVFDEIFETAARHHLEVLPALGGVPGWVSHDWRRLPIDNARRRQAWARFVEAAVERYEPGGVFWQGHLPGSRSPLPQLPVHVWQVWNEENFFYFTRPASPNRYARLLAITDRAVHRADPRADVLLGGLFGDPGQRPPKAMDAD
ncbi:MAG TPA: hypothetical protein VFJ99_03975, partial [Solirubrobacterales bacterium]|nr:hypothetical protein [Solirubrobacterales bacterium]